MYDLNQIPYDYIVEVKIDLGTRSDRVAEELWMEVRDIVQEIVLESRLCLCWNQDCREKYQ